MTLGAELIGEGSPGRSPELFFAPRSSLTNFLPATFVPKTPNISEGAAIRQFKGIHLHTSSNEIESYRHSFSFRLGPLRLVSLFCAT